MLTLLELLSLSGELMYMEVQQFTNVVSAILLVSMDIKRLETDKKELSG